MVDQDEDLQLALELSKKSYEDEVKRRSRNEPDLISFENPGDRERQEKIDRIKNLINQKSIDQTSSNQYSWNPEYSSAVCIPSSSSYPLLQSSSLPNHHQNFYQQPQIQTPPPRPPKNFPPNPYVQLFPTTTPPPLPPRLNPPLSVRKPQYSQPNLYSPSSPVQKSDPNPHIYPILFPTLQPEETAILQDSRRPLNYSTSLYDYLDADLYVPHTLVAGTIMNGDLIDLGDPDSTKGGPATFEQIRREFDPLYRVSPEKDGVTMAPAPTNRQEIAYTVPAIKSLPVSSKNDENKENHEIWLTLDDISFQPCQPEPFLQVAKLKESGRNRASEASLFFQSPTADYLTTSVDSVKVVIQTDHTWNRKEHVSFTFDIGTTMDLITAQVLSALLPENETLRQYCLNEYGVKVFGLDEFLPPTSQLGHSVYVGKCLLQGKDVKLEIGKFVPPRKRSVKLPLWENMKSHMKYLSFLDKEDVENVKVHLAVAMKDYESAFNSVNTLQISAESNKVRQIVKQLCDMLNSIEPCNLHTSLQNYLTATTLDQLRCFRNDFIAALHNFLYVYCKSTMSEVLPKQLRDGPTRIIEVWDCKEKLKIMINSLHNLPVDWLRECTEFDVIVEVYYGTRLMDTLPTARPKTVVHNTFFPCVPLNYYVAFKHLLCLCPRETKIMFKLRGIVKPSGNQAGSDGNEETKRNLAFGSIPLFDHKMLMRQGQLFVPLTLVKQKEIKPWGPHPLIGQKNDPVVIVTLPTYDYHVQFPEVAIEYQSAKQDFITLKADVQSTLMDIIESGETEKLTAEELELLWQKRAYLMDQPEALPLVLNSVSEWGYGFLSNVYQILEEWVPLSPVQAMQLLLPQYADVRVRQKAVEWILNASSDFLFNAIPQLVEALRYELFESSSLAMALLTLSYKDRRFAFEIYWQLQQRVDHCHDYGYSQRCILLQKELLDRHESDDLSSELYLQHELLSDLDCLQMDLKMEDNDHARLQKLRTTLGRMDAKLLQENVHLPILPSFKCSGVAVQECSIFNSNAKPLKIVFRGLSSKYAIIHKSGDDMRQDAMVLQMVGLMNDVWLSEGLDLRVILFRCMPCGFNRGMAELVSNCATLCDIQKEAGVTGVFKDDVLKNWIQKHNNSEFSYKVALDNFTRSCAGWCVATYILGIGDRHNDNILVTTTGHVFHIDFGKYMGDWQTAAGFKRDRVPFVFTLEMYHVINEGSEQRESYQNFIDYCCKAFNFIRRKHTVLTNILKIMACSDVAGVNMKSIQFVEKNLMLDLSETDAIIQFTELINASLNSAIPRLNFFIHTLAQMVTGHTAKDNPNMLTFVPQLHKKEEEGLIKHVKVMSYEKRMIPHKVYLYKTVVCRENQAVQTIVYRTFDEYNELYVKLRRKFPSVVFPPLNSGTRMRSNVAEVAQRRMFQIQQFLQHLFSLYDEIRHCDLVYTFFHLIFRDSNIESYSNNEDQSDSNRSECQAYLKIEHDGQKRRIKVFVGHVRYLAKLSNGQFPDAYVKTYFRPDPSNSTKRKTQVVKGSLNPTFNRELYYDIRLEDADHLMSTRVLEISIWNSGGLMDNHKMYMTFLPLTRLKSRPEDRKGVKIIEGWFELEKNL